MLLRGYAALSILDTAMLDLIIAPKPTLQPHAKAIQHTKILPSRLYEVLVYMLCKWDLIQVSSAIVLLYCAWVYGYTWSPVEIHFSV